MIHIRDLSFTARNQAILKNIDLDIAAGKWLTLIGPSGSGKSTFLRLLNGLIPATGGIIEYRGEPIDALEPGGLRRRIGLVQQTPVMIRGTVRDNLCLRMAWENDRPISDPNCGAALEQVGLDAACLSRHARELSGGEKQRVAIARILLNEPDILLLDEPTANLDPRLGGRILQTVKNIQAADSLTIIMVSHNHEFARKFSDNVAILLDGQVMDFGPPSILDNSTNAAVKEFLSREIS